MFTWQLLIMPLVMIGGWGGGGVGGGGRVPQLEFNFASSRDFSCFKPVALRKAKIVYSYGLYKCNRVKLLFFA